MSGANDDFKPICIEADEEQWGLLCGRAAAVAAAAMAGALEEGGPDLMDFADFSTFIFHAMTTAVRAGEGDAKAIQLIADAGKIVRVFSKPDDTILH